MRMEKGHSMIAKFSQIKEQAFQSINVDRGDIAVILIIAIIPVLLVAASVGTDLIFNMDPFHSK